MSRRILRGFISILGTDVAVLALSLVITPILVRLLGSAKYGDYAFVLSVLSMVMIVVNAGIFDGIRKYIAEDRDPGWQGAVFGFYLRVGLVIAVVAAVLISGLTTIGVIATQFGPAFTTYFLVVAGLIIVRQLWAIGRGTLMGLGYEHISEPVKVVRWVIFAIVGLGLVALGYGITGALVGRLIARGTVMVFAFAIVFRKLPLRAVFDRPDPSFPRRSLLMFNSLSVILILLMNSLYEVDILLLRIMRGSVETGFYKAALVVAEFLWFVPTALQTVLLHSTSELWMEDRTATVTALAARVTRYTLLFVTLLALGLFALADEFVPLYFGQEFSAAVAPLIFLLPGTIGFAVARPVFAIGQGKGSLRPLVAATGIAAALNLLLNLVLIPRYGMRGAAVATSVGYGSMLALHLVTARRIGFNPVADLRPLRVAATGLIAAPIILLAADHLSGLIALAIVPGIGFAVYTGAALAVGAIDREELAELRDRSRLGVDRGT